jgi:hypothetical protein
MANGGSPEKPTIKVGSSGVSRVEPADILRSKAGQAEINKAADVAIALKLREPQSQAVWPVGAITFAAMVQKASQISQGT